MRRRRLHRLVSAALIAGALFCLWAAGDASQGIQGASFTEDVTAPSRVGQASGHSITATVILWILAAVALAVAAVVVARRD